MVATAVAVATVVARVPVVAKLTPIMVAVAVVSVDDDRAGLVVSVAPRTDIIDAGRKRDPGQGDQDGA